MQNSVKPYQKSSERLNIHFQSCKDSDLPGGSASEESACNPGDLGLIPGLGRSPEEGNGNQLQYSCLEKSHGQRSLSSQELSYDRAHSVAELDVIERLHFLSFKDSDQFKAFRYNLNELSESPGGPVVESPPASADSTPALRRFHMLWGCVGHMLWGTTTAEPIALEPTS